MKNGDKVGVIEDFHSGDKTFTRGQNIEVGKDLTVEEASQAARARRLAAPLTDEQLASQKEADEKAAAEKAAAGKAAAGKAKK